MTDPALDRVAFAGDVLGLDLFDHQAEVLRASTANVVLPGGRRSGKSVSAQVAGLHSVTTRRGARWLVTGPNADKVRQCVEEMAELARGSKAARGMHLDAQAMRIDFPGSGGAIVGVPPTGGQLRGHGRDVFGVHIEEAGHCPASVWRDVRYALLDHRAEGAEAWMTGSPWGSADHFFPASWRLARDGDRDYWAPPAPWTALMNPRLPGDWIERERGRLNSIEAAAELDGEWAEDGLQFFPRWLLDRCTADVEVAGAA